ncbi:MAG TPA: M20 family metallopeptidase [Candidatus Baltobacteraceae bacterium]|nr:M20 family metallopeptidase [Candidatus Baltobacteraceae bacterium]
MDQNVREKVTRLLCELVAIPSYRHDEETILKYLVNRFERQGIGCRITNMDGKPLNLVAEIGSGPRRIILNSHVDTVPPGDPALWASDPLEPVERDGKIYGRGSEDAKGCLASMIVAFETLAARPALPYQVVLMAVGAEERGGLGTRLEVANGMRADAAIIGESTGLVPQIAHKGVLRLEVEVIGKAAHASDPEAGVNAITGMAYVITALDRLAAQVRCRAESYTGHASLVVSTISGGTALNVIPARCVISIDRRVLPTEKESDVHQEIVKTVGSALPAGSSAKTEIRTVRFVLPSATAPDAPIVCAAEQAASRLLGKPITAVGFSATCDMTYLVNGGSIPTVILGPGSIAVAHQADEYIAIDELTRAVPLYLDTIETWAKSV